MALTSAYSLMTEPNRMDVEPDPLVNLLLATAHGDRDAFARLYDASSARLFGVIVRIVRRREAAEEVLQEAFVKVWQSARSYSADLAVPGAWLAAVARNSALDHLRREKSRHSDRTDSLDEIADHSLLEPLWSQPEREYDDRIDRLGGCWDKLEEKTRQVLALSYTQGLSHGEVSARLALPLGTVKTWIRRGLLRLRECMGT